MKGLINASSIILQLYCSARLLNTKFVKYKIHSWMSRGWMHKA